MEWIIQPINGFDEVVAVVFNDCPSAFSTTNCAWYSECNGTGRMIIVQT